MIWIIIAASILLLLFFLPLLLKGLLNRRFRKMNGFTGSIKRLKINLLAGKIVINDLHLFSTKHNKSEPLLQLPTTTIIFRWKSLLKRVVDLNIILDCPDVFIVSDYVLTHSSTTSGVPSLQAALEKLLPFRLNAEVRNAKIRFISTGSKAELYGVITDVMISICDLSNRKELSNSCLIKGSGQLYEGMVSMSVDLLPLAPMLTFDLNMELKAINLVLLNDIIRSYGKVDINEGTLDLYTEIAVANNEFKGYIKPIIKELDFIGIADRGDTIFQKLWERTVATFVQLVENNKKDQLATKIPIEGRLDDPHVKVMAAIIGILRNAFIKALTPSLEDIIDIGSIWESTKLKTKGIFKSIFKK